jgi:glycosyltransferase involved in cell wall biosynthesis
VNQSIRNLVIVTDFDPRTHPGAATIALRYAECFSREFNVTFLCHSNLTPITINGHFSSLFRTNSKALLKLEKLIGAKVTRLLNKLTSLLWLLHKLPTLKESVFWVHNIGSAFPKSTLLLLKLFNFKVIMTIHDYTWLTIKSRKLYPSDLKYQMSLESNGALKNGMLKRQEGKLWTYLIMKCSLAFSKKLINLNHMNICISHQQKSIYTANGVQIQHVVPNYVPKCQCNNSRFFVDNRISVLFAGRLIGKGLEQTIDLVRQADNFHLHLAGGPELKDFVQHRLDSAQYTYHGLLNSGEMTALLHSVNVVSVLSQCFDVWPSTALEALTHKVPVLVTNTCGLAHLVAEICTAFVFDTGEIPNATAVAQNLDQNYARLANFVKNGGVPTERQVTERYRRLLDNVFGFQNV